MSLVEHREGIEAGRLDMFVDGAFAFTLTLLAIGGETIPNTAEKLLHILAGVPAAAICFAQIAWMGTATCAGAICAREPRAPVCCCRCCWCSSR